jgi:hypothetical protein
LPTSLGAYFPPAFFTALAAFLGYLARDFGKKMEDYETTRTERYKLIRARIRSESFYPPLTRVVIEIYASLLKRSRIADEELEDRISSFLYHSEPWRGIVAAVREMESSLEVTTKLDQTWERHKSVGSMVKAALYMLVVVCLSFYLVSFYDLQSLWLVWLGALLALSVFCISQYARMLRLRGSLEDYERKYFVRAD